MNNEVRIVNWFLVAKSLIKFTNDDKNYKLAENVLKANDFATFPIAKGDSVEVAFQDSTITFLRKVQAPKVEEPKVEVQEATPEVKKEEPPVAQEVKSVQQEFTIFAVSGDKKFIKFTEIKDQGWFATSEEIRKLDYAKEGIVARNKAVITVQDKNLIAIATLAPQQTTQEAPSEVKTAETTQTTPEAPKQAPVAQQTAKKEWKPYNASEASERQTSIEAQASVNSACAIVGRVIQSSNPIPTAQSVINMIRPIAEANFQLIQELKKK